MSYLAIGSVTKAIAELLSRKLNKPPLLGAGVSLRVSTLPPDDERVDDADGINLFLYRVEESPFAKNRDWPEDRSNSTGSKRPPLTLTLHYLLTAYAKKSNGAVQDDITAHQILGNAMTILHEYPVLNDIHDSDFDASLDTQFAPELRQSFEKIKITLATISMEEFSKIWTGLSKAYRLSVAYDVSLVQIAPIIPTKMPGPPVQETHLQVITISAPAITSITPSVGSAGVQVSLKGVGFKIPGMSTSVLIDDINLGEADLVKLTPEEIVLTIPEALQRGPKLRITISTGDRESAPVFYEVKPWISIIQPLRGVAGIPLTIPLDIPSVGTVGVEIDGQVAAVTLDAPNKLLRATVPTTLTTNGPKSVVVTLSGPPTQRSNTRFFELLPSIQSVNVTTSASPVTTTITITGQRLDGKDVHVKYGSLLIRKGENTTTAQVIVEVSRTLPPNQPVSVIVDGRESNVLPPYLELIEPSQTFAGDLVTLTGKGLSGQAVVVSFGATTVNVGPHAYSSRLTVKVPSPLAPGTITIKVTVNGVDSNLLPFEVIA
jgi:hypothetical protein